MSSRSAAPTDLKDPEVTKQNLPKGETWDENECVFPPIPSLSHYPLFALFFQCADRDQTGQSELKLRRRIRSLGLVALRKYLAFFLGFVAGLLIKSGDMREEERREG